jgi:organic radical activating enzyme
MTVDGHTFTSNSRKMLKHLDKLQQIQRGENVAPVMVHLALTNKCNLDCSYCCYGGRDLGEELTREQGLSVIEQFTRIGTRGIEFTGGGEPTLHPHINEFATTAKTLGASLGLITNGMSHGRFRHYDTLDWVRLSTHVLNWDNPEQHKRLYSAAEHIKKFDNLDLGGVYIWTDGSESKFSRVVDFVDKYQMPTRVTPDLTKGVDWIRSEVPRVKALVEASGSEYAFMSDFNIKTERSHLNCFMRMIKPYVHPDGNVYECPGASFDVNNFTTVSPKFKVCGIEDIVEYYTNSVNTPKQYDCNFCKYQIHNDLINEIVTPTRHNDFA